MAFDSNQDRSSETITTARPSKPPRKILEGLYAFAPNRHSLGGTSYFIVENTGNILLDCPAWEGINAEFLHQQGVKWLYITHRGAITRQVKAIQEACGCEVIIQEQEAYLLPQVQLRTFEQEITIDDNCFGFWTPGHSPGSSCLYWPQHGGVLFAGRHLLPNSEGNPVPLRLAKTFHWGRQLKSVQAIRDRFTPATLNYICPGANTGLLRGKGIVGQAYQHLGNS